MAMRELAKMNLELVRNLTIDEPALSEVSLYVGPPNIVRCALLPQSHRSLTCSCGLGFSHVKPLVIFILQMSHIQGY